MTKQLPKPFSRFDGRRLQATASWVLLYIVTLVWQWPCLLARLFVFELFAVIVAAIEGWNQGTALEVALLLAVALPLAWSLLAVAWPGGSGWWAAMRMGARTPSQRERQAYDDALASLQDNEVVLKAPRRVYVLDDNTLNACVLGDTLILNRMLIDSEYLAAVLAHELGHLNSPDARVTVAINRLAYLPAILGALPFIGRLLSGELGLRIVWPAWAAWFRTREFEADRYAARLGQGEALAEFLEAEALFFDRPVPFAFMSEHSHPFTEHRIDRLNQPANQTA